MNRMSTTPAVQILCLGLCLQGFSFLNPTATYANTQMTAVLTQGGPVQRASLPVLYRHFLAYQVHLDRAADALGETRQERR